MASPMQEEALRQTMFLQREISLYKLRTPPSFPRPGVPVIRSAGRNQELRWEVSHETISGDFSLDEILAQELAARAVSNLADGGWLNDYLNSKPGDNAKFDEYLKDSTLGPGNILGNANSARQAAGAVISNAKYGNATKLIQSGKVQAVKIDRYTTMYNANKTGKGSPRLRVRVRDVPTRVAKQVTGRVYKNGAISVAKSNAKAVQALMAKAKFVNSTGFGAALTFAPTAAFDLVDTVDRDVNGTLHWNYRQFVVNEFKNQGGNLATFVAGAIVVAALGSSAPVLIGVFIGGIFVQAIWNSTGMSQKSGSLAEKIMDSDWPDIDTRFLCP